MDDFVKVPVPKKRLYRVSCARYVAHLTATENKVTDATEPFKWAIGKPLQFVMCIFGRKRGLKVELVSGR